MKFRFSYFLLFFLLFLIQRAKSQDLDPRAYVRMPINTTLLGVGIGYSEGGVLTDPSLPIQDLEATLLMPSIVGGYVFETFGKTSQFSIGLPFAWADASALINGAPAETSRTGFGDIRMRYSILLLGGDALTLPEFAKAERKTILGASLSMTAPTGQYYNHKLINLGTYRWAFKPEIALSQPVGKRWLFDLYAGVWFFTTNNQFYPESSTRDQKPLGSFQGHISYNFTPRMWAAINTTYYTGGNTVVNGIESNDRQDNSRVGATFVFPIGKTQQIKTAVSRGAIIRSGANFTSISIGWQMLMFKMPKPQPKTD